MSLYTLLLFENDVKMYGTQTTEYECPVMTVFENDVKMYGTQTVTLIVPSTSSLRMM